MNGPKLSITVQQNQKRQVAANSNNASVKVGCQVNREGKEVDDVGSDISLDEWGEVQKYGQQLHRE